MPSTEVEKSSGLIFHYSDSYVGERGGGVIGLLVPWETLKLYLTPEGVRIFGGVLPKSQGHEEQQ